MNMFIKPVKSTAARQPGVLTACLLVRSALQDSAGNKAGRKIRALKPDDEGDNCNRTPLSYPPIPVTIRAFFINFRKDLEDSAWDNDLDKRVAGRTCDTVTPKLWRKATGFAINPS
ncbi:hypothetical protein RRG08_023988 [Elysia crispata]|uniref:Uncharacterized protein n=1 Tax=Elysia crispata TaxID=231223 RepID=A0AAE1D1B8_9GAST|nr:hypothetical protein RRG08_023988 [Elysia crispata]